MIAPGSVISYLDMCQQEKVNLQRGMNYKLGREYSVILMSVRNGAPYADKIEENGAVLIYEGHNISRTRGVEPEKQDQQMKYAGGGFTQNGKFLNAAMRYKNGEAAAELIRVYEKIRDGIWVYNGLFQLLDGWQETSSGRKVFKFRLEITDQDVAYLKDNHQELEHTRMIPSEVKQAVWARDKGKCRLCESSKNLHFDHILPFSRGGTSLLVDNIQLLCAKHNLQKHDKIE